MLQRIEINNYKMFRDFAIDFAEGVSLICGQNGSGKSSLLELLHSLVGFLAVNDIADYVNYSVMEAFPPETFCRWGIQPMGSDDMTIRLAIGDECNSYRYSLIIRYNFKDNKHRVEKEALVLVSKGVETEILSFSNGTINMITDDNNELSFNGDWSISGMVTGARNNSRIRDFCKMISQVYAMHLDPAVVMMDFKTEAQSIGKRGERFSAWQFHNSTNRSENQIELIEYCKNFVPGLVSINSPLSGDVFRWKARVKYCEQPYDLELRELSDGQKMLFVLYSILANIPNGSTLIIDEPENYLAPGELQPWLDAVNDAWEERKIQFILITHNPKTINWYHKEAFIFKVQDEPPRIVADCNSNDTSETLFQKLCDMEWVNNA